MHGGFRDMIQKKHLPQLHVTTSMDLYKCKSSDVIDIRSHNACGKQKFHIKITFTPLGAVFSLKCILAYSNSGRNIGNKQYCYDLAMDNVSGYNDLMQCKKIKKYFVSIMQ